MTDGPYRADAEAFRARATPTLADVARQAGVSISAVSRVLRSDPASRVSAETRQRILDAATEINYRPNFAGRALKSARTRVLGLVVPDLTNILFRELMRGAEEEAARYGYTLLLGRADGPSGTDIVERLLGEGRVDGVVVQVDDGVPTERLIASLGSGAPAVLINCRSEDFVGSVVLDDASGARLATEHLLSLGHTKIGFVNGVPRSFTAKRRHAGWKAALADAGLSMPRSYETRVGYHYEDGLIAAERLLGLPEPPTGIVVANINAAVGVLTQARGHGVAVPEDLSIVSVHDSWTGQHTCPPISAVKMPFYELGRSAARDLIDRLVNGRAVDRSILTPEPELFVRGSSAPPPRG
ncbi:MAG: LacI family DNA-binding transcriptional regulator [Nostocoides sp.]